MFETLSESCLRNSKMISADSVCHMVEAYKRMGFVERFKTLCVKGIPVIPSNIRGRSIIANVSNGSANFTVLNGDEGGGY